MKPGGRFPKSWKLPCLGIKPSAAVERTSATANPSRQHRRANGTIIAISI